MLGHLWSKHRIDKDHPDGMNMDSSIIKAMHIITKRQQEKLVQGLVEFIIEDCQPLNILRYIEVTAMWIDSNFILREALLTIKPIQSPHTAENILSSLDQVISEWELIGKCHYTTIYQIIDDVSTRWNSLYLAWIRLKELQKAINYLVIMLPLESERYSFILLLKPFYDATIIFSGSNYPKFNLIYPTMKLLIKKFEPSNGQTEDDYADILFGPREQISDQSQFIANKEDSSKSDIEYEFETPKEEYHQPLIEEISNNSFAESSSISISNNLIADLYSNEKPDSVSEEIEVDHYINEPNQKKK
ncbi:31304_t:CDS:2, partial [Gigaspora margarita]